MPNRTLEQRFADHEERLAHVEVVVEKQSKELDIQFKRIAQLQAELDQAQHGNRQRQSRYRDPFREVGLASFLRPPEPTPAAWRPRAQPTARRSYHHSTSDYCPQTSTSNSERIQNLAR